MLFCGVFDGVDRGVTDGVLAAELGADELSSWGPLPFSKKLSLSLNSLAPFLAFLNKTEVRRPTPPPVGRGWVQSAVSPLVVSFCNVGGGVWGRALVQLRSWGESVGQSGSAPSSLRRLQALPGDKGSRMMGFRVGGSRGSSPCRGGGAGPVGSSVGGDVNLRSSAEIRRTDSIECVCVCCE